MAAEPLERFALRSWFASMRDVGVGVGLDDDPPTDRRIRIICKGADSVMIPRLALRPVIPTEGSTTPTATTSTVNLTTSTPLNRAMEGAEAALAAVAANVAAVEPPAPPETWSKRVSPTRFALRALAREVRRR